MQENIRKFEIKDYKKIKKIYKSSFSKEEQFPFFILIFNILRKNSNLFVFEIEKEIVGFIHLIYYKNTIFILYLAINQDYRNNGYGSTLLNWCTNNYSDKAIFLNIDEVNNKFSDYEYRKKRLDFYLKNNFYLSKYLGIEKYNNFNILSTIKNFNIDEYKELDKKISKWYFAKNAKIKYF